jgi:nucleoside-diphosphate-sugar epimerase
VLVTGAGGYFGGLVVREILEATTRPVIAWGRSGAVSGDLTSDAPFASVSPGEVSAIIHCAAVTRFNVSAALAGAVNVAGTEKLIAFARSCPQLESLALVSSFYASGLRDGAVEEELVYPAPPFANHYEASKWAAERAVSWAAAEGLPVRILRLPTIIADDESGRVVQRNAFHNTLRLLQAGLLSLVPGDASVPLYFTSGRWAARAAVALALSVQHAGVFHLGHDHREAVTLGALLDDAYQAFAADPRFRERRLPRAPLADRETFALISEAVQRLAGPMVAQALASITPFAPQLFVAKRIDNRRLRAALPDLPPPAAAPLARAAVRWLVGASAAPASEVET